jgi:transposase InsO family protein
MIHVDTKQLAPYVEVLADEQRSTTVGSLARALGWFSEQGITCRRILSDNGPSYRSGDWRKACHALALKPIRIKPYSPQTNGKAERFIKTLLAEWAYVIAYQTSEECSRWLPRYLGTYNGNRCQMAFGGLTPQQCLQRLLIAE